MEAEAGLKKRVKALAKRGGTVSEIHAVLVAEGFKVGRAKVGQLLIAIRGRQRIRIGSKASVHPELPDIPEADMPSQAELAALRDPVALDLWLRRADAMALRARKRGDDATEARASGLAVQIVKVMQRAKEAEPKALREPGDTVQVILDRLSKFDDERKRWPVCEACGQHREPRTPEEAPQAEPAAPIENPPATPEDESTVRRPAPTTRVQTSEPSHGPSFVRGGGPFRSGW